MRHPISLLLCAVCALTVPVVMLPISGNSTALAQTANPEDRKAEADRLIDSGNQLYRVSRWREALQAYQTALDIYQEINDRAREAQTLNNIGEVNRLLGDYPQALAYYEQSLVITRDLGEAYGMSEAPRATEAATLNNIGLVNDLLGNYPQALAYYEQSLVIKRDLGDRAGEARTLNNIGAVKQSLGNYPQALAYYEQSLVITRDIGDRATEALTLNNIGIVNQLLGNYPQALAYYEQSLVIKRDLGDRAGEAQTLNNIGLVNDLLGNYPQALAYYEQSLVITRDIGDRATEALTLSNIGIVNDLLGNYPQALAYYEQSLVITRDIGDRGGEAGTLNNIGIVNQLLGNYPQALAYYEQSLVIKRDLGDRAGEAQTLNNIGLVNRLLGNYPQALAFYEQSLVIKRDLGDRAGEAQTLANMGYLFDAQQQSELAIVFLKQAVNQYETIRENNRALESELQESYTAAIADDYRQLADLLLQQDRILEAQQVLDLLKVQELDDYLRGVRGNDQTAQGVDLLPPEQEIVDQYFALLEQAIPIGQELTALRQVSPAERTEAQAQRIEELVAQQQQITQLFTTFIRRDDVVAWVNQLSRTAREQNLDLSTLRNLSGTLQDLRSRLNQNAVLLYPLVLDDRLELVLVTPDSPPINRTVNVSRVELNRAIETFRRALEDPSVDAVPAAQQLYQWLIQPIQADLDRANTDILIAAPDAQLRYIPLAALHDGTQWLTQRYLVNYITAASLTDFAQADPTPIRVLAGAFTEGSFDVQVGGQTYTFDGLNFADDEVNDITALMPDTKTLLDGNFSAIATVPSMDDYTIVHFATHAAFFPGRPPSDSFILFGNGDRVSLQQVENEWFFTNVDLIVLSACQTGLGGSFGGGEEILGFGYLMQNAGARAAIASLWEVSDGGTQSLMTAFYGALQQPDITKAAALQEAQIALITGNYSVLEGNIRSPLGWGERVEGDRPAIVVDNLSHPYYWAPFILIGNGL